MPKAFEEAVRKGAKIRTKKLPGGKYIRIAITGKGKSVGGEVHKKKENPSTSDKKKTEAEKIAAAVKIARRYVKSSKPKTKSVKKKGFALAIHKLRKRVGKLMGWETKRTKDVKRQLRKSLSETDIKKFQRKK